MEDTKVHNDGTVRGSNGQILDFVYGGDGLDAARLERVRVEALAEPEEALRARLRPEEAVLALAAREAVLACKQHLGVDVDPRVSLPFHPARLLRAIEAERDDDALEVTAHCARIASYDNLAVRLALLDAYHVEALARAGIGARAAAKLFALVDKRMRAAWVHNGEMVGAIAAQSLSEPATQMTLNSFHTSGCVHTGVVRGIPRLRELIDQAKHIKTPSITVRFTPTFAHNKELVTQFAQTLPLTRLNDIGRVHAGVGPGPVHDGGGSGPGDSGHRAAARAAFGVCVPVRRAPRAQPSAHEDAPAHAAGAAPRAAQPAARMCARRLQRDEHGQRVGCAHPLENVRRMVAMLPSPDEREGSSATAQSRCC